MRGRGHHSIRLAAGVCGVCLLFGRGLPEGRADGGRSARDAAWPGGARVEWTPPPSVRLVPGQEVTLRAELTASAADEAEWISLLVRAGDVAPRTLAMVSKSAAGPEGAGVLSISFVVPEGRVVQVFGGYRSEDGHAVMCREVYRIALPEDVRVSP
ncbi:MAG: hypothetical protein GX548_09120 [Lentisphaerae bacterium]|nr:hypothetical protein [Lentisphaerota bacterium]